MKKPGHAGTPYRVGGVQFLNARPLVYGLEDHDHILLEAAPPSQLASGIESGHYHAALVPSIDYQATGENWTILPVAAIGSAGKVLTVQVFSHCRPEEIETLAVDPDSHTSIALAQVVWSLRYRRQLEIVPLHGAPADRHAILLIGDKVLEHLDRWPHAVDLGREWNELTSVPFVYAFWAARQNADWTALVTILRRACELGTADIDGIVARYGQEHGFDAALGKEYLTRNLSFAFGRREKEGLARFYELAHELNLIPENKPLQFYGAVEADVVGQKAPAMDHT